MRVAKLIVNFGVNRDAGVDSRYLAVSEKFSFFDLSLGADCIGVLAGGSVSAPADCIGFGAKFDAFLDFGPSRLYRCFAESPLFVTFAMCDSWYFPQRTGYGIPGYFATVIGRSEIV